jgi:hypothetical protein
MNSPELDRQLATAGNNHLEAQKGIRRLRIGRTVITAAFEASAAAAAIVEHSPLHALPITLASVGAGAYGVIATGIWFEERDDNQTLDAVNEVFETQSKLM